jgi:hypothetical protein
MRGLGSGRHELREVDSAAMSLEQAKAGQSDLLQLVVTTHGGLERFQRAREITVAMHGSGAVVRGKRLGRIPGNIEVRCDTREQSAVVTPYPVKESVGFSPARRCV